MLFDQIARNKRKTILLLIIFFLLLSLVGAALGVLLLDSSLLGLVIALLLGAIYAFCMVFQSTDVVMSMNNAQEVDEETATELYRIVEDMAMVAQIPMPRLFVLNDTSLNAFATGSSPKNAAVAVTRGLLATMNREELEGVIGHEISHIRNYDIRISTIAVALSSAISFLSNFGSRSLFYGGSSRRSDDRKSVGVDALTMLFSLLALILAPLAASLIQLAISRQREYLADASSVELTRNPQGMIRALEKLEKSSDMSRDVDFASAALFINDPKKEKGMKTLFYTHPLISDRIERLKIM